MYTDHRSIPESASRASLEAPGFNRPPLEYIATDWIWEAHPNGSQAVYEAIVNYSLLHGCKFPSVGTFERVRRSVVEQQRFASEPEVYHPCDGLFCLSNDEPYMAAIARQFGYVIAIAQPMGSSEGPDVYDKDAWTRRQPPVKFRFVAGPFQELYPPIFLGRYMGVWFSLVARNTDVVRSTIGEDVQPAEISNIWASLHNIGLLVDKTGMLILLAYLWQLIQLGLDVADGDLTAFLIHFTNSYLAGSGSPEAIRSFSPGSINTPSITTTSLLKRIAMFSGNKIFRAVAIKAEEMAIEVNLIAHKIKAAKKTNLVAYAKILKETDKEMAAVQEKYQDVVHIDRYKVAPPAIPHEVRDLLQPPSQPLIFADPDNSSDFKLGTSMGYMLWDDRDGWSKGREAQKFKRAIAEVMGDSANAGGESDSDEDGGPSRFPHAKDDVEWTDDWRVDCSREITTEGGEIEELDTVLQEAEVGPVHVELPARPPSPTRSVASCSPGPPSSVSGTSYYTEVQNLGSAVSDIAKFGNLGCCPSTFCIE